MTNSTTIASEMYPYPLYTIIAEVVKPYNKANNKKSTMVKEPLFEDVRWMVCYFQSELIMESGTRELASDLCNGDGIKPVKTLQDVEDWLLTEVEDERVVTDFKQLPNDKKDINDLKAVLDAQEMWIDFKQRVQRFFADTAHLLPK